MTPSSLINVAARHVRLTAQAHGLTPLETPPFLSLFAISPEREPLREELGFEEIVKLSEELGSMEALQLGGDDPLRRELLPEIVHQFARHNGVAKIQLATDGRDPERSAHACRRILESRTIERLSIDLTLDPIALKEGELETAIASYDAIAELQQRDPRLHLALHSTVGADNIEQIEQLSNYLYARCPQLERHNLTMPRGAASVERRAPDLGRYLALDRDVKNRWADRERGRLRRIVRPALAWTSAQTASRRVQIVPCKAGVLSAVVYANGDVSVCETVLSHPILGNLRERSFRELWHSPQAQKARTMIRTRQCACTNEVFLSPSVTFQPAHLVRALVRSKVRPQP